MYIKIFWAINVSYFEVFFIIILNQKYNFSNTKDL